MSLSSAPSETSGNEVLLVEDNESVAEVTRDMLEDLGYTVSTASDAATALTTMNGQSFSLVVSDIKMSGPINGLEFARLIRGRLPQQAILLVTGYSESAEAAASEFAVLRKPYRTADLENAISALVRNR